MLGAGLPLVLSTGVNEIGEYSFSTTGHKYGLNLETNKE